jgi:hypothetical protein
MAARMIPELRIAVAAADCHPGVAAATRISPEKRCVWTSNPLIERFSC